MRARGPACTTCRQKGRRCDRVRPACNRCLSKGVICAGYPDKFRFCGPASRGKWKSLEAPSTNYFTNPPASTFSPLEYEPAQTIPSPAEPPAPELSPTEPDHEDGETASEKEEAEIALLSPMLNLTPDSQMEIDEIIASDEAERLISHYDRVICPHQIAQPADSGMENPYQIYVLPLAYKQAGVLYSVLALSACHLGRLINDQRLYEEVAVNYRLMAISALGATIQKANLLSFDENNRDAVFATIQLLLLHDICESGISENGAHISGAMSICSQLLLKDCLHAGNDRMMFFLGNLAWLDIVRAFSHPDRLCFTQDIRERLLIMGNTNFESVNGCPRELVLLAGELLESSKAFKRNSLGVRQYLKTLESSIEKLYAWNSSDCVFPDEDSLWIHVANAFQHTCILIALRLLDPTEPPDSSQIQESVSVILDSVAQIPRESALIELVVLPLFIAGTDCIYTHSRHYILMRIGEIKARSEMSNFATKTLLHKVWEARDQQLPEERKNVPWMVFTEEFGLAHQHDYLVL